MEKFRKMNKLVLFHVGSFLLIRMRINTTDHDCFRQILCNCPFFVPMRARLIAKKHPPFNPISCSSKVHSRPSRSFYSSSANYSCLPSVSTSNPARPGMTTPRDLSYISVIPPDGGWGWAVSVGVAWCNGAIFGVINNYSKIMVQIQHQFPQSSNSVLAIRFSL